MNKKGFTIIEILIVITAFAIIVVSLLPYIVKLFGNSSEKSMYDEENNVLVSSNSYINDYCINPLTDDYSSYCVVNVTKYSDSSKYVCLSTIINSRYIENIYYKNTKCNGFITYDVDNSSYSNGKVYLSCGEYYTDGIINVTTDEGELLLNKCK